MLLQGLAAHVAGPCYERPLQNPGHHKPHDHQKADGELGQGADQNADAGAHAGANGVVDVGARGQVPRKRADKGAEQDARQTKEDAHQKPERGSEYGQTAGTKAARALGGGQKVDDHRQDGQKRQPQHGGQLTCTKPSRAAIISKPPSTSGTPGTTGNTAPASPAMTNSTASSQPGQ